MDVTAKDPETILVYVGLDLMGDGLMKLPFVRALRNAGFTRHHDVNHQQVVFKPFELAPRLGRVGGGGDAKSLLAQVTVQKVTDTGIVVDDQKMCRIVGKRFSLHASPFMQFLVHCGSTIPCRNFLTSF